MISIINANHAQENLIKNNVNMALLFSSFYDSENNEKHSALDRQIISEQNDWSKHYNPIMDKWRYKLIDKKSNKYFRFTRIRKIGKYETFIDQFDGKYKYVPWPYKKRSLRKIYWFAVLLWRNKLDIANSVYESKITKEIWVIIRSVIVLLLAYLIWAVFGEEITSMITNN